MARISSALTALACAVPLVATVGAIPAGTAATPQSRTAPAVQRGGPAVDDLDTIVRKRVRLQRPSSPASPDSILVRWAPRTDAATRTAAVRRAGASAPERRRLPAGWTVVTARPGHGAQALHTLRRSAAVLEAEPDQRKEAAGEDVYYAKAQRSAMEAIRWPQARALVATPGPDTVVAVLDSGVDATHPDLAGHVLPGWDAITRTSGGGTDALGHGTEVAGLIGASTDNDIGIAGVASGVSILPVRVLDAEGSGWDSDIAAGVVWAVDHGADVVNLSLAGPAPTSVLESAVTYAVDHGVVVVAAAGNARGGFDFYPASYPAAISVGSANGSGDVAGFSEYNDGVDLVAPGVDLTTLHPGGYARVEGTSFSAPLVAGAAALLLTQNPGWTPRQVVDRLTSTALDTAQRGKDQQTGWGLLDLAAALGAVRRPVAAPAPGDAFEPDDTPARAHPPGPTQFTHAMLSPEGDVDWWSFQAPGPSNLDVSINVPAMAAAPGLRLSPSVELFDSRLQPLRTRFSGGASARLPAAGTYYARVASTVASRSQGDYILQWTMSDAVDFGFRDPEDIEDAPQWMEALQVVDLDGDDRQDVVTASQYLGPQQNQVGFTMHQQQPDGELLDGRASLPRPRTWVIPNQQQTVGFSPSVKDLSAGDVDGDGDVDLAILEHADVAIARQSPGGVFDYSFVHLTALDALLADVTGDGIDDLVTGEGREDGTQGTYVRAGSSSGRFGAPLLLDGRALHLLNVVDVDRDGDSDVVGVASPTPDGLVDDAVRVVRQTGAGGTAWQASETAIGQGSIVGLDVGQVLGAGNLEVVLAPQGRGGDLEVRTIGTGGALGTPLVHNPTPPGLFETPYAGAVRVADINGDGRDDAAMIHEAWGRVDIAISDGTGFVDHRFADMLKHPDTGDQLFDLGDVNGDSKPDLVEAGRGWPVTVMLQRSTARPPTAWVRDTTPSDRATGVSVSMTPSIVLARSPDPTTITERTARLVDVTTDTAVATTPTWTAKSSTLSIDPVEPLTSGHSYEVRLGGILDASGLPLVRATPLSGEARFRFTVGSPPADVTAPDTVVREDIPFLGYRFVADASEPGTRMECSGTGSSWVPCDGRSSDLPSGQGTEQTRLYVRTVDGAGRVDPSPLALTWGSTTGEPPPNDSHLSPTPVTGSSGQVAGSTLRAQGSGNQEGDAFSGRSVFWSWTAPASGRLDLSTAGSDFDTVVRVARITGYNQFDPMARADDVSAADRTSRLGVDVVQGREYLFGVGGFGLLNPRVGAVQLRWSLLPRANQTPTIGWSGPAGGSVVRDSVHLTATASDPEDDGKGGLVVRWHLGDADGRVIGTDDMAPFQAWASSSSWPEGTQRVTAVVTDADGATAAVWRDMVVDRTDPLGTLPRVRLSAGSVLRADGTVPVTLSWTASDPGPAGSGSGSGIDRQELYTLVDDTSLPTEVLGAGVRSVVRYLRPGRSYRFEVSVVDRAELRNLAQFTDPVTVKVVQDRSRSLAYSGRWRTATSTRDFGGTTRWTATRNAIATWRPPASLMVGWVARRGPTSGTARVLVDGIRRAAVDLRSNAVLHRRMVWVSALRGPGHEVDVRALGTVGRPRVDIDAMVLLLHPPAPPGIP